MSWAVGWDSTWQRDIGYGVPAQCDEPGCDAGIDRGLAYVCGGEPYGGEHGCGLYFCSPHGGGGMFCHHAFADSLAYTPSADVTEWVLHKLTDPSWRQWRDECPHKVEALKRTAQGQA